jgi:fatty-acyl-CoA synthase
VSRVYWNKPEETAETFVDGFCKTGDVGSIVGPGLLKITGRKKDMIKSGGENVYPAEVEAILTDHPAIKDAAVIGVPDARFQEAVCAVLTRQPGAEVTEEEVIKYCRQRLAGYKKPKHVVFVDELPRNPTGKILKYLLRDQYRSLGTETSTT